MYASASMLQWLVDKHGGDSESQRKVGDMVEYAFIVLTRR